MELNSLIWITESVVLLLGLELRVLIKLLDEALIGFVTHMDIVVFAFGFLRISIMDVLH